MKSNLSKDEIKSVNGGFLPYRPEIALPPPPPKPQPNPPPQPQPQPKK